jgi:hypothetical protein
LRGYWAKDCSPREKSCFALISLIRGSVLVLCVCYVCRMCQFVKKEISLKCGWVIYVFGMANWSRIKRKIMTSKERYVPRVTQVWITV